MRREVAESAFEILFVELTRFIRSTPDRGGAVERMDALACVVGQKMVERSCLERKKLADTNELIKYVCREFWAEMYGKQMDTIKRNKFQDGSFILGDSQFRPLVRRGESITKDEMIMHLAFAKGLLRGAFTALNMNVSVIAEVQEPPVCSFSVDIQERPSAP